jgi:Protein of unknown function (DUF3592)
MPILVAEIFLILGVIIAGVMLWQLIKGMKSKNWPTAPGQVVASQVTVNVSYDDDGDRSTTYGADIMYRYAVDGYEYSGNRRTFTDYKSSNRNRAEKIVAQYAPGTAIQTYYHPDDPEDSVLEPGTNAVSFLLLLLPLIFIGVGVAGLLGLFG